MRCERPVFFRALAVLTVSGLALGSMGCGGTDSTASKSAAAYAEAKRKGLEIGGEHGGHGAHGGDSSASDAMAGMDHSQTAESTAEMDHSGMQPGSMAGMDHSQHRSESTAGTDHSRHQSESMAQMDHSEMQPGSMPGMDHSQMQPGMHHGAGDLIPSGGLWGPVAGSLRPAADSSSATAATTLGPDSLDAAAPISIREAQKSVSASHDMKALEKKGNEK